MRVKEGSGVRKCEIFFFKQKTAYEISLWVEFRRVLFRSPASGGDSCILGGDTCILGGATCVRRGAVWGRSVDLGGRRIIIH